MIAISVTGLIMSTILLLDPLGIRSPDAELPMADAFRQAESARQSAAFLLMLSLLVLASARQAVLVLRARAGRSLLRRPVHVALQAAPGAVGLIVGYVGVVHGLMLLMVFAVISVASSVGALRYIFKPSIARNEWTIEHLGSIIGCGIGAYTAFFAFGGRRFLADVLTGQLQLIPWILPSVIGVTAISLLSRRYRRRYRITRETTA